MDERLEELFPFYALGVLAEAEKDEVEAYMAANPAAQARLAEASQAVSALPYGAKPIQPSAQVKTALMARINSEVRSSARPAPPPVSRSPGFFERLWQSTTWNVAMPALAALSLLVALLAGFWAMSLNRQIAQLQEQNLALGRELTRQAEAMAALSGELAPVREENTTLRDEVAAQAKTLAALNEAMAPLQEENAALKQDVANQAQQLAALNQAISQPQTENVISPETVTGLEQELAAQREQLDALNNQVAELQAVNANLGQELSTQRAVMAEVTSPDVQAMKIAGTETLPGAQGQLIANPVDDQAVLIVSGLPPLEPGLVYQFWLVQNGQLMRAGVFRADESGLGLLQVTTTTAIGSYEAMGVSVEPANSSGEPTNDMIMLGNFSS
jgi:hypothetical protein